MIAYMYCTYVYIVLYFLGNKRGFGLPKPDEQVDIAGRWVHCGYTLVNTNTEYTVHLLAI